MSRFAERLERDLDQIADRATPSTATAWDSIRTRIDEQADEPEMEIIMLAPDRNEPPATSRRWLLVAAAVVSLALVGGLIVAGTRDDVQEPIPADRYTSTLPPDPADLLGDAEELPLEAPTRIEAGRYRTDTLGVPAAFSIAEASTVSHGTTGEVALTIGGTAADLPARTFVLSRLGGWYTAAEAVDPDYVGQGSIGPYDVEGWIAANGIVAERRPDLRVDGRSTKVWDVRADETSTANVGCAVSIEPCFYLFSLSEESMDPETARSGVRTVNKVGAGRMWVVAVDGFDPILIQAGTTRGNEGWFEEFESTILPTIEFGPDGPPKPRD